MSDRELRARDGQIWSMWYEQGRMGATISDGNQQIEVPISEITFSRSNHFASIVLHPQQGRWSLDHQGLVIDGLPIDGDLVQLENICGVDRYYCQAEVRVRIEAVQHCLENNGQITTIRIADPDRSGREQLPQIPVNTSLRVNVASLARLQQFPSNLCQPLACKGCRHYHGETYRGVQGSNPLICAMHPYGPEGDECSDREGR